MSHKGNDAIIDQMVDEATSEEREEFEDQIDFSDPGLMAAAQEACVGLDAEIGLFEQMGIIL